MEGSVNQYQNFLMPNFSCNFETETSSSGVDPIPYNCSLKSIASGLQLREGSTKPATGKNEPLKHLHSRNSEKSSVVLQDVIHHFDPTKDLLYIAATTQG